MARAGGRPLSPRRYGTALLLARVAKNRRKARIEGRADGGCTAARRGVSEMKPESSRANQSQRHLPFGRGGWVSTGQRNWSFLAQLPALAPVIADESEPGTFKDRMIMNYDPHQLIEVILPAPLPFR